MGTALMVRGVHPDTSVVSQRLGMFMKAHVATNEGDACVQAR